MRSFILLLNLLGAGAFNIVPRRDAIFGGAVAALMSPVLPVAARSKASVSPNKPEGVGANAGQYIRDQYKAEYAQMAGDKGSRGVASKDFERYDTVQRNRELNGGVARDKDGRKIATANRNRSPKELGLRQWDGK